MEPVADVISSSGSLVENFELVTRLRTLGTAERLPALYELGIEGCAGQNTDLVTAVILELVMSLNFRYADVAEGFYRLYNYCLRECHAGNFDRVIAVFDDLRESLRRTSPPQHDGSIIRVAR